MEFSDMKGWWNAAAANAKSAVLSSKEHWETDEFFKTGRDWLQPCRQFAALASGKHGAVDLKGASALDFGCGLGRMTHALADTYDKVLGIDISEEMIKQAEVLNHNANVQFCVVGQYPFDLPARSFDLVFSTLVIQHIPAPHNRRYVRELFGRVSEDGFALIDAPSKEELPEFQGKGVFFLPFHEVMEEANVAGLQLIGLRAFGWHNAHYQYLFQRRD